MLVLFQLCVLYKSIFQELLYVFSYSSNIVLLKLKDFFRLRYLKFLAVFQLNFGHFNWLWMYILTRVLKHYKYVIIKQFSKIDIKQNNISTVILLIKFLLYQWDPRHLQGSRVVYIFVYIMKLYRYLITFFVYQS